MEMSKPKPEGAQGGHEGGSATPPGRGAKRARIEAGGSRAEPRNRDKVLLRGLQFFGYHGVLKEETELGQRFIVDVELGVDTLRAGTTDDLEHTVNYAEVYEVVKTEFPADPVEARRLASKLIESVAEHIAAKILRRWGGQVLSVQVTVKKPHVAVGGIVDYLGVQICRTPDDYQG